MSERISPTSIPKGAIVLSFGSTFTGVQWLSVITYRPASGTEPVDMTRSFASIHEAYNWLSGKLVTHRQHTYEPKFDAVQIHHVPALEASLSAGCIGDVTQRAIDDAAWTDDGLLRLLLRGTTDYPSKVRLLHRDAAFCLVKFAPGKQWKSQLAPSVNCPPWVERYDAPFTRMQAGRTVWKSDVDGKLLPATIERLIEREKKLGKDGAPLPVDRSKPRTADLDPDTLATLRARGGTWAVFQNVNMDSSSMGRVQCLRYGLGCTYTEPPTACPDTANGAGYNYVRVALVDAANLPDDGKIPVTP